MAMLEVQDFDVTYLTKHSPPFQAVKKANLVVEEGEIVGLVGESGSGKSTLGNAAIRLLDATFGEPAGESRDVPRPPQPPTT